MNKNIIRIKRSVLFVVIGLVTLGSFSTTFSYWRRVRNNTQYQASGTIYYIGCAPSTFSLAPGVPPFHEFNACLVDKIDATVFPNWNAPSTSQGMASFISGIVKNVDPKSGAINVTWKAPQISSKKAALYAAGTGVAAEITVPIMLKQQGTAYDRMWSIVNQNGVYSITME